MTAQHGQSISEFLVVAVLLLIPLLLIVPVLASVISQQQDIELGARYAVWEYTTWDPETGSGPSGPDRVKTAEQLGREIDARLLAQDESPLISDAGDVLELDPFSRISSTGQALPAAQGAGADARYITAVVNSQEPAAATAAADAAVAAIGSLTRFDLERRGVTESSVALDLVDLTPIYGVPGAALDTLQLRRSNALFTEAWTGGSTADTQRIISGLTPQQYFDRAEFRAAQRAFAHQPYGQELGPDVLKPGHVDIEPLPEYRLGEPAP